MATEKKALYKPPPHELRRSRPSETPPVDGHPTPQPVRPVQVIAVGCETFAEFEPHALGVTYWFDAAPDGEPYPVTIRFTGRRIGVRRPGPQDSFTLTETVSRVVPGSGRVAITIHKYDIAQGEWQVTATPVTDPGPRKAARSPSARRAGPPNASSWGTTGFAPIIRGRAPGVRLGAWPLFVAVGVAVAVTVQAILAARAHLPVGAIVVVSLIASLVGLVGAKVYYLAEHAPRTLRQPRELLAAGMCIQGFVLAAIATAIIAILVRGLPPGLFLDVSVPGLLFAMAIGRFGCFFGGCCVGRPTSSRWGLWSSDRRVGMRRVPTQLLESALASTLGLVALLAVLQGGFRPEGAVFVASIAMYVLGRQLLFPLRDLPRHTSHGRALTMIAAVLVVLADVLVVALG